MAVTAVCEQCAEEFTAQRSTARYCSERCKQRAKRARARAEEAEKEGLDPRGSCAWCQGPLYDWLPVTDNNRLLYHSIGQRWSHTRKYCSPEHRNAARRFRYRVAKLPNRVIDPSGDPFARAEPAPCWRTADWHQMAGIALTVMGKGWVLTPPPGDEDFGVVSMARLSRYAAGIWDEDEDAAPAGSAE